ncbi:MAG: 30S ribosomal protein S20 [Candidatus Marinimicrobia bacterium]|nr:30S ribosomal protein S20 [Candidatus Neomarinimicrobiota bacterium]|tara:strand:+ start:1549 stop:1803 length:255 start_codon:yes stop_codon:yes gene_type:complete
MDRHPQQIKRERQDKKRRVRNLESLSKLRTSIKKVLSSTTKKEAELVYKDAVKVIDKAVSKNLIHKNTGARRKSQITRFLNSLS